MEYVHNINRWYELFKTPSAAREQEIMNCIEKLGKEYLALAS